MAEETRLSDYEKHAQLVAKGQRIDGRKLDEFRDIKIEVDAIRTADASSLVKLGNTSLVCGCTYQVHNDKSGTQDQEDIRITVELPPICSGPQDSRNQSIGHLITSTVKDILDATGAFDLKSLHIPDSDSYWSIDVEVVCLNYDGAIVDAALIAILSALKSLKLSSKDLEITNQTVQYNTIPICTTFAIINDKILCEPNLAEESVAQSTLSISVDLNGDKKYHINKVGGRAINTKTLLRCIRLATQRAENIVPMIENCNK